MKITHIYCDLCKAQNRLVPEPETEPMQHDTSLTPSNHQLMLPLVVNNPAKHSSTNGLIKIRWTTH